MLCRKPYTKRFVSFACGSCLPCRITKRRTWTHRIMLEAMLHEKSSFVTLTYDDEHLPPGASLVPRDMQLYLKRLRFNSLEPLRFFGVGEYGEKRDRPHYHLAIFGRDASSEQFHRALPSTHPQRFTRGVTIMDDSWDYGNVHVGTLTFASAAYIAGYTTKKLGAEDVAKLDGRHPEFARMSLRPGIGAVATASIGAVCRQYEANGLGLDVPHVLQHGRRTYPLGRYMRARLRAYLGRDEKEPDAAFYQRQEKMLSVFADFLDDTEKEAASNGDRILLAKGKRLSDEYDAQRAVQMEVKEKLGRNK